MKTNCTKSIAFLLSVLMLMALLPAGMLSVLALDPMSSGNTVYLDGTNGSDSNDGTNGKPVKTLAKAVALLEAGDKSTTGYVYFVKNYTHNIVSADKETDFDPAHTRHIVYTSDPSNVKTMTVETGNLSPNANWADRHYGATVYVWYPNPVTFDAIKMLFTNDKSIKLTFQSAFEDKEVTLKDGTKGTYTFNVGDPFYATYVFTKNEIWVSC